MNRFFLFIVSFALIILPLFIVTALFFNTASIELKVDSQLKQQPGYFTKEYKILSYLNNYKSQQLWRLDLKKILHDIEDMSLGIKVYARKKYPDSLIVFLNKKNTALLLLKTDHTFYPVSHNGELGIKKNLQEIPNVPILRGAPFEQNKALRQKALKLMDQLPAQGSGFSSQNISEVSYHKKHDSFLFYLFTGLLILELKAPLSKQKIKNVDFVLSYLKKIGRQKAFIDARLNKKIIVKKNF